MTKIEIPELLDELQNEEAYIRNAAIKKIIKGKIGDERIITALKEITENDPYMAVRNFARAALDVFGVEHSAVEEPVVELQRSDESIVEMQRSEVHIEENKPVLQTEDAVKIGLIIGIIPTILVVVFFSLIGGGYLVSQFVSVFCTPIGIPGGIAGALIGKSLNGSRNIVIIGSVLGTILGIIAWLFSYELLGAPFGYIG